MPLYFAYGSNLDLDDLDAWAQARDLPSPNLRFVGRARLPDHALRFHYRSPTRRGGALDVASHYGSTAAGVLFETDTLEVLDRKEGVESGRYARRELPVVREDGSLTHAITYQVTDAHRREGHVEPTDAYLQVVRRGLRRWGLDEAPLLAAATGLAPTPAPDAVFVYGTLKRGHCRASIMERARPTSVRRGEVGGTLVDLGEYPGLVLAGAGRVQGEVWTYDDPAALLGELDEVEDFEGWERIGASLYVRSIVAVNVAGTVVPAWTYVWRGSEGSVIASGSWTGA